MQIAGEWYECDDGVRRPTILVDIRLPDKVIRDIRFVVDTGADHTVLSASLLPALRPLLPPPPGMGMAGVGGSAAFGVTHATLELRRPALSPVTMRGEFAVLTELGAIDMCVLGRDVTEHFDVIVSQRRNAVLPIGGNHHFSIQGP